LPTSSSNRGPVAPGLLPPLVCPRCRRPPEAALLDPEQLICTNPACATRYPRLTEDVPVVLEGGLETVASHDELGELEPLAELPARLAALEPGGPEWEHLFRLSMYLVAYLGPGSSPLTELCERLLPHVEGAVHQAVELGCGVGVMALELARRTGATVVGIDGDPMALRFARIAARGAPFDVPVRRTASRFEQVTLEPPVVASGVVRWICADALQPPLVAESFDLVAAINVLDSVRDPWLALGQASALLREGGYLLLAQPDAYQREHSPVHWLGEDDASWDAELARVGLETVARTDGIILRYQRTDRVAFEYTLHGRLAQHTGWGKGSGPR
jgi:SAM-dependent methyltransferase